MARRRVGAFVLERGARVLPGEGVDFSVWAPRAKRVCVRMWRSGRSRDVALERHPCGTHRGRVEDAEPGEDYVYLLDGGPERADPVSRHQARGVGGPSRIVDPSRRHWTDTSWRGVERGDLVVYELHVGTFTEAGSFDGVVPHLPSLRDLGVTAIELMPIAQFPGERNWGYDGVFPYAPQCTYGGPEGLAHLVDAAHGAGLAVLLDVVYNHLGPEGNFLNDFGPYFTDRYRTPWGPAINLDGPESDDVRRYFVENALYWIEEFHLDGLRLDATHEIYDFGARPFLEELAAAAHGLEATLDRRLHVIAESDRNDPRLVRPIERGGLGLDAQWSDDLHHAVHAALTGERAGYYADFGGVDAIAKALRDRFVYDGVYSPYRRRRHGAPATDLAADRFVVFAQNHDQVGNRALGERLATLLSPERLRVAAALTLLSPFLPLLFMGEEYGETNPFLYFVSHADPDLLRAVREGRRREFAAFRWDGELPDPAAPETFHRSRLQHDLEGKPGHAEIRELHRELLRARREVAALRPGESTVGVAHDREAGWITVTYHVESGRDAFAAFHLGPGTVEVPPVGGGPWRLWLSTDDPRFGGRGAGAPERLGVGQAVGLGADAAVLYVSEED